jgi:putative tryptophan/tyrosine transport system substrate-binding protein
MKRRELFFALGGAAAVWPLAARAQAQRSAKVYRVAIASPTPLLPEPYRVFLEELRRLGHVEGQNLFIERHDIEQGALHDPELARDVVRRNPDVILAMSNPFVQDFKAATTTIPIVGFTADPVAFGIVPSLAHPGGNITGVSVDAGLEVWGKRLGVLKQVTEASKIGFLASPIAWDRYGPALREAAAQAAISITGPPLQPPFTDAEYRRVLSVMRAEGAQAMIVSDLPANLSHRELVVELADKSGLPTVYPGREFVEVGGLIAYTFDMVELYRQGAQQIAEILRGRKPSEIPYYQLTKFALVINLKTALGLTIPPTLLATADEVIE